MICLLPPAPLLFAGVRHKIICIINYFIMSFATNRCVTRGFISLCNEYCHKHIDQIRELKWFISSVSPGAAAGCWDSLDCWSQRLWFQDGGAVEEDDGLGDERDGDEEECSGQCHSDGEHGPWVDSWGGQHILPCSHTSHHDPWTPCWLCKLPELSDTPSWPSQSSSCNAPCCPHPGCPTCWPPSWTPHQSSCWGCDPWWRPACLWRTRRRLTPAWSAHWGPSSSSAWNVLASWQVGWLSPEVSCCQGSDLSDSLSGVGQAVTWD